MTVINPVSTEPGQLQDVDGIRCRQLIVLLDLTAPAPRGSSPPWIPEWPDPTAVPMTVWIDGPLLRRLRYQEVAEITYTLTLRDPGLDLSSLDWDRLGTFRTPDDKLRGEANSV